MMISLKRELSQDTVKSDKTVPSEKLEAGEVFLEELARRVRGGFRRHQKEVFVKSGELVFLEEVAHWEEVWPL